MTGINLVSGTPDLAALLAAGDIQGAIQLVMGNRVQLLDAQLAQQIQAVQDRNDQISKLNDALAKLNAMYQYCGNNATDKLTAPKDNVAGYQTAEAAANNACAGAGAGISINTNTTHADLDAAVTKLKGLIDTASNNQQMDMLRLQSLNNKRDEAFDLLTNTQKSFHDTTSGIVRNL